MIHPYPAGFGKATAFSLVLLLAVVLLSFPAQSFAQGITTFFPLKINSPQDSTERLTRQIDEALGEAVSALGMNLLLRDELDTRINPSEPWPPQLSKARALLADSTSGFLVIGSFTSLGQGLSIDLVVHDLTPSGPSKTFFRELDSQDQLGETINALTKEIKSYTDRDLSIAEINVSGNIHIDSGAIRQRIKTLPGAPFSMDALRDDLKSIFRMGHFYDVKIISEDTDLGKKITFAVKEKEIIGKVLIAGNSEVKEEDIRPVIKVRTNSIYNDTDVRESIENIRQLYHAKGYRNCEITTGTVAGRSNRLDITFTMNEGEKVFIKRIRMTGNVTFSDDELRDELTTKEKGFFSFLTDSGLLKMEELNHDGIRITAFYHNNGFVEAKVDQPEVVNKGDWFEVTYNISEGDRFTCGTIDFSGDLIEDRDHLMKFIKVTDEPYFSRKVLREDILRISDYYAEKGYAFAEIVPKTFKDQERNAINLAFSINKGDQVSVNRIIIRGNTSTRDKVIRRELLVKEGGIFSAGSIKRTNQALQRLDYFETVNITPEETAEKDQLDLIVEITEKPTGKFSIGAGYSNVERFSVMGEVSEGNLFGRGQRLSAQANLSSISTRFNIDFTEPRFLDTHLLTGINVYNWNREYDDYDKDSQGGAFRLGYPIKWGWHFTGSYGYDNTNLDNVNLDLASQQIIDSMNYHVTSSVKSGFVRDTRNRNYGATSGSRHSLTVEYAGGFLGGDNSFTKSEASTGWYFPITEQTSLYSKFSVGRIDSNSQGHLPIYEKFYLGGLNSIRSFKNGEISPIDYVTGDRIGGDKMWYANIEYQFPLIQGQGLQGVIFYDIGNVYAIEQGWDFAAFKNSAGIGFRWLSPIGPLRLEWGYNLKRKPDERQSDWEFSIGSMF